MQIPEPDLGALLSVLRRGMSRARWSILVGFGLVVGSCVLNPQPEVPADNEKSGGGFAGTGGGIASVDASSGGGFGGTQSGGAGGAAGAPNSGGSGATIGDVDAGPDGVSTFNDAAPADAEADAAQDAEADVMQDAEADVAQDAPPGDAAAHSDAASE
ncbi:MAG TPA: hypothetical protein PKA88_32285 [Polyangiaceae bacterium]|nr:hypothetical protein [Polyangiaceae bacterium]